MDRCRFCFALAAVAASFLLANQIHAQEGTGSPPESASAERQPPPPPHEATPPDEPTIAADEGAKRDDAPLTPAETEESANHATISAPNRMHPAANPAISAAVIQEPSQGRPIFIMPGETFFFVMRLAPDVSGDVTFWLRHAIESNIRVPLKSKEPPSYLGEQYCNILFLVPRDVVPGLYDVEIQTSKGSHFSRRSVKVVDKFKTKFRFVHLSNMNIGDPTAPEFDHMLPSEINLLDPEFIIATGDYTEWARARDDASSWLRVLDFFEKFNAPVFMLCGLHDHEASFTDFVASKPIGTIDYGAYHGLLLLDHPGNPIDQDYAQLQWIAMDLKRNKDKRFNFIASNSDELALLDIWEETGGAAKFIKEHHVKMFITGGSCDWDYVEFAKKLRGMDGFHYIRTHQASTAMRDRATGFSHYRVIEVDGDNVSYVYANDTATEKLQYSVPTGRLRAFYDNKNDGSAGEVTASIQNALNQRFDKAAVWLRVAKRGNAKPVVAGGELAQVLDGGDHWTCKVDVDLPDKGAASVIAANAPNGLPQSLPIKVTMDGPKDWQFQEESTDFGLRYYTSPSPVRLTFTNTSDQPCHCYPVIRINGSRIHPDRGGCPRLPLTLEPGQTIEMPLVLNLRRLSPGSHALQVYFVEDPLARLQTFEITLSQQTRITGGNLEDAQ